ncbi:GyrI-like domain-containing protein [Flocculibacter collagenilyticus]|uniref:GyrI-like domain-containing protein n=1 Tax=Flocculibacter collagenilyticus TaxID=2744479 RepID=UPI0018F5D86A|nr:GyrI-like domain-containing protein [Flocculibacter collagenilyticus]
MEITQIENIDVKGIAVRTDNLSEMDSTTAKIGSMWERFYAELAPSLKEGANVYGLYTNYESDHNGVFDVIACSDKVEAKNVSSYQLEAGNYLVFKGTGQMPQVVIDLWRQVWEYFESPTSQHKRTFTTDFELYKSENEVELFISV